MAEDLPSICRPWIPFSRLKKRREEREERNEERQFLSLHGLLAQDDGEVLAGVTVGHSSSLLYPKWASRTWVKHFQSILSGSWISFAAVISTGYITEQ